jgi:hypothetical protein
MKTTNMPDSQTGMPDILTRLEEMKSRATSLAGAYLGTLPQGRNHGPVDIATRNAWADVKEAGVKRDLQKLDSSLDLPIDQAHLHRRRLYTDLESITVCRKIWPIMDRVDRELRQVVRISGEAEEAAANLMEIYGRASALGMEDALIQEEITKAITVLDAKSKVVGIAKDNFAELLAAANITLKACWKCIKSTARRSPPGSTQAAGIRCMEANKYPC